MTNNRMDFYPDGFRAADPDEITRPDNVAMSHWRRLMHAFDSIPADWRETFVNAVVRLSDDVSKAAKTGVKL